HSELGGGEATGVEYLLMLALSRLVLDNFPSLQASWVTQGGKVGQLSLAYGSNDMGSVIMEENAAAPPGPPPAWTKSRSCAKSRTPGSSPSAATCITRSSAIRIIASRPCRGP